MGYDGVMKKRKRVNWKPGLGETAKVLPPYYPYEITDVIRRASDAAASQMVGVTPGALFQVTRPILRSTPYPDRVAPPFPYLLRLHGADDWIMHYYHHRVACRPGDMVVYLGEVRVEEGATFDTIRQIGRAHV